MTENKPIIIDGIDITSKNNKYRLGRTKIERQKIFEDIKKMIENGFSLQNIADKYGVTRQAISLKMTNGGFNVSQEVKRIKREKIKKLLEETSVNNVEKLNRKVKYYKTYNIRLRNDLAELKEKLSRKEQECDMWKNLTVDNGAVALKYQQQLDHLKVENKIWKNQVLILDGEDVTVQLTQEQFEEYNNLKAENETYKQMLDNSEVQVALTDIRTGERDLWQKYKLRMEQAEQKLERIKDIAKNFIKNVGDRCIETTPMYGVHKQIIQICNEVISE